MMIKYNGSVAKKLEKIGKKTERALADKEKARDEDERD